ncbi:hypothetical protein GQ44DRAFT_196228 [Phaeosphaeriaceae sp. PMI808]|nr:hypothetical protein GQ44DRAFT_196228 [Phaeosphaeriaceae sp. PMI808]
MSHRYATLCATSSACCKWWLVCYSSWLTAAAQHHFSASHSDSKRMFKQGTNLRMSRYLEPFNVPDKIPPACGPPHRLRLSVMASIEVGDTLPYNSTDRSTVEEVKCSS